MKVTTVKLVKMIARDLRLDARAKYELGATAEQLDGLTDAEIGAKVHAHADRATDRLLAGAICTLGAGISHERFASSLGAGRGDYEARMHGIDTFGTDVEVEDGGLDLEEAAARAHELRSKGETVVADAIQRQIANGIARRRSSTPED